MPERVTLAVLIEMLEGDRELVALLVEHEILEPEAVSFAPEDVERVLVARTLVRDLEVNPPGVEIILRLRAEMLAMRRQVHELLQRLAEATSERGSGRPSR